MIDWQVLKDLSNMGAISGREEPVIAYVADYVQSPIQYDRLGSAILTQGHGGVHIMLATHADEVGFIVSKIEPSGFLRVQSVGNMWTHTLLNQLVVVQTSHHQAYTGVLGGPAVHSLSQEQRQTVLNLTDLFIDMGVDSAEAIEQLGIQVGDMGYVHAICQEMADSDYIMGKALDNRIGVSIGAWLMRVLKKQSISNTVSLAMTVQEEVGLRGARTSAYSLSPDLAIAIDTMVAGDTPLDKNNVALGKGVGINVIDSMTVMNRGLLVYLEQLCQQRGIPYQLSCCVDGGTDAGNIHKSGIGILATTLSIPIRYMHTHQSIIHKRDVEAACQLLLAIIEDMTENTYQQLLEQDYLFEKE